MNKLQAPGRSAIAEAGRSHLGGVFELLAAVKGKTCPADHIEEDTFRIREGYQNFRLDKVEDEAPDTDLTKVPRPDLELVYFARSLQRTQLIGHFLHQGIEVPVHYAITGSIILERKNRKFKVWGKPLLQNNVLVPYEYVKDKGVLEDFKGRKDLKLLDSGGDRPEYTQLRISAVRKARQVALELRGKLYLKWLKAVGSDPTKVIAVDGMVADVPNKWLKPNFIALSNEVYVPFQNSELLEKQLLTKPYRRGAVMKITNTVGTDPMPKYSWFVRLRSSAQADPEFGLIRATCIAQDDADAIKRSDAFSARLIDERLPVTFPADNWDKLIFPMKLCNDYLNSMVPTRDTVKSYFARD